VPRSNRTDERGASVKISFVGSGDAFGSGGRFQTCIHIRSQGLTALVDCGATTLTAMKLQGLDPGQVDAVAISHLHGDHFGGLPFLILDGQFSRRTRPLTVLGPAGTRARLRAAMETLYPGSAAVRRRFAVDVVELDGEGTGRSVGPLEVKSWQVEHASGAPSLALRATIGDGCFAYSGDTSWTAALLTAARGADVFACEAYTYEREVRFHLSYASLLEHADELTAGRLVVTHMGPSMLSRLSELSHQAASDGLVLTT
jgi:ribonuclease BN (tRNA processing enzyme)